MFYLLALLGLLGAVSGQRADGQFYPCNPIENATGVCLPNPGLTSSSYSVDFTKTSSLPSDWTLSNYETVNFGLDGAEFTYAKRYDAPQIWTNFYILFGKVDVVMRVANGTGMISSSVLISDDYDEIDFEFSGNNFGNSASSAGEGQNNYFGKGITGNYDRGQWFAVSDPQDTFHTYTVDWSPTRLIWAVDGQTVRTFQYSQSSGNSGDYQYPQTPSKLQLGVWAGGDSNSGTVAWAGGPTNFSGVPYTMYVKSVNIQNTNPCYAYNWTDQSGTWQSIQMLQQPQAVQVGNGTNATVTPIAAGGNATSNTAQFLTTTTDIKSTSGGSGLTTSIVTSSSSAKTASSSTAASSSPTSNKTSAISSVKTTSSTSVKTTASSSVKAASTSTAKASTAATTAHTTTSSTAPGFNIPGWLKPWSSTGHPVSSSSAAPAWSNWFPWGGNNDWGRQQQQNYQGW